MKKGNLLGLAIAATALTMSTSAFAKLEKVNIVKEGIDTAAVVVRANSGGYTTYQNNDHTYQLRLYAKAKGNDRVFWIGVSRVKNVSWEWSTSASVLFDAKAGASEGWSTYAKSINLKLKFSETYWTTSPKQACINNLNAQVAKGMKKSDVLKKEWTNTTLAGFYLIASTDSKSHNKKNNHSSKSVDFATKGMAYPVNVVCKAAG